MSDTIDFHALPSVEQARTFGDSYADYIAESLREKWEKGIHSTEYVLKANLGDLLAGNDGD